VARRVSGGGSCRLLRPRSAGPDRIQVTPVAGFCGLRAGSSSCESYVGWSESVASVGAVAHHRDELALACSLRMWSSFDSCGLRDEVVDSRLTSRIVRWRLAQLSAGDHHGARPHPRASAARNALSHHPAFENILHSAIRRPRFCWNFPQPPAAWRLLKRSVRQSPASRP